MFTKRCRLLAKRIYNSISMFTEDNLATAQIAQLFGSELLKVQQNATTDSGTQPNIVNINPKQFLINAPQYQSAKKAQEQHIIQMLQREAEAACPLPESPSSPLLPIDPVPVVPVSTSISQIPNRTITSVGVDNSTVEVWEKINKNLERIANRLENVDITIKKKRVKRTTK
jgi:hypothetical protein